MVRKPKRDSVEESWYDLEVLILLEFSSGQSTPAEIDPESSGKLRLDAVISGIEPADGGAYYCNVKFECSRSPQIGVSKVEFEATYTYLYSCQESKKELAAKDIARSLAWSRFVDLFSLVNAQMHAEMPALPLYAKVRFSAA